MVVEPQAQRSSLVIPEPAGENEWVLSFFAEQTTTEVPLSLAWDYLMPVTVWPWKMCAQIKLLKEKYLKE